MGSISKASISFNRVLISAEALIGVVCLLSALHFLITLATGGYVLSLAGMRMSGKSLISPVLALSAGGFAWSALRGARRGWTTSVRATSLLFLCLGAFLLNRNLAVSGDVLPATYLPLAVAKHGALDLNGFPALYENGPIAHSMVNYGGRVISTYPIGAALTALPFYAPAALSPASVPPVFALELGKIAAASIAAVSAALLYAFLLDFASARVAGILSVVYAFGTSTLSSSSQMLWQHGPAQLLMILGLWILARAERDPRRAGLAGVCFGLAVVCRPTNALVFAVFWLYTIWRHGSRSLIFLAGGLPAAVVVGLYNLAYYGTPTATAVGYNWGMAQGFTTPFWEGLAGIVLSPGRGLLVYSPVAAFAGAGLVCAWKERSLLMGAAGLAAALVIGLHAKWDGWWGGVCFGPRLLSDSLPFLAVLSAPVVERIWRSERGGGRLAFAVLAGLSVWIHAMGAGIPNAWDGAHLIHGTLAEDAKELWKVWDGPLSTYASDLLKPVPGSANVAATLALALVSLVVATAGTRPDAPALRAARKKAH